MLKSITLENVRVFKKKSDPWNFPLKNLTVFCGTNSVGKSTLLKIACLFKQSMHLKNGQDGKLAYTGSQVDFGDFMSFVSKGKDKEGFSLSMTLENEMNKNNFRNLKDALTPDDQNSTVKYQLTCTFHVKPHFVNNSEKSLEIQDFVENAAFHISWHRADGIQMEMQVRLKGKVHTIGDTTIFRYMLDIPGEYFRAIKGDEIFNVKKDSSSDCYTVEVGMYGLVPGWLYAKRKDSTEKQFYPLPPLIDKAFEQLRSKMDAIHYIGPFRAPAKRYYLNNDNDKIELDPAGEFLPYLFNQKRNTSVLLFPLNENKVVNTTFNEALGYWLHYFRTGDVQSFNPSSKELEISLTKGILIEMSVTSPISSSNHALIDSGFGYSQVMPILAKGLLAAANETIIIEQPELHLNPALQVRLAFFIVSLIKTGKQVILETHSEHMVNAIRVASLEDHDFDLSSKVQIHFLDVIDGNLKSVAMSLKQDGSFDFWPKSFFGEALDLSARILRAQKNKSKK